jgi:DNA invertase Pin-like site-specific DNA recombinase
LRVSTVKQDLETQKHEIEGYCERHKMGVDEWLEVEISSRKNKKERRILELLGKLKKGDTLMVSELSRLGRSIPEVVLLVDGMIKRGVSFISIKQNIVLNGKLDMQGKVVLTIFSLMAELERDLISERTKVGLANAKAKGVKLGNPDLPRQNTVRKKLAAEFAESLRTVLEGFIAVRMTQRGIVEELNRIGVKTRRGGEWKLVQVQNVLNRLGLQTLRARS